jgi:hypothetical protein
VSLGSVSTLSMFPRVRSISKLNPVSAYLIFLPLLDYLNQKITLGDKKRLSTMSGTM